MLHRGCTEQVQREDSFRVSKTGRVNGNSADELRSFLAPLKVSAISGVGKKTEEFLGSIGVKTIGDLQKVSGKELVKYFGKTGVWLWGVANGLERIEVKERPMRSLSAEHTFEKDVSDKGEVVSKLEELATATPRPGAVCKRGIQGRRNQGQVFALSDFYAGKHTPVLHEQA